jgi:type I restriction enzyme R subunit
MQIDGAVKTVKRDGWRGNLPKEREIKAEIYKQLASYSIDSGIDIANEPPAPFGMESKTEAIFNIVREQKEY